MDKIIIEITKPEKGWERYGEVSAIISINGKTLYGGVGTFKELTENIKTYYKRLN